MKQRSVKCVQTTSLSHSNAKSTIKVPLTLCSKKNMNMSILLIFFLCLISISQQLYCPCKYSSFQTIALLPGIFLFLFGMVHELQLVSYGLETVFKDSSLLIRQLWGLKFLFTYFECGMYSQATPEFLSRSSRIVFLFT